MDVWPIPCVVSRMSFFRRSVAASSLALLAVAGLSAGCSGSNAGEIPTENADSDLTGSTAKALAAGEFATTERAGGQLDPIGCRHYQMLHLNGLDVTVESKLDAADRSFMDDDGSCGGEELPKGAATKYPVKFVEKTSCGATVFEGTIKWTESGRVTRTMRLTDYRGSRCKKPARVVAVVTSQFEGKTNPIGTFFSVDPVK